MVMIINDTVKAAMIMVHAVKVEQVIEVVVNEGQDIVLEEKVIYISNYTTIEFVLLKHYLSDK